MEEWREIPDTEYSVSSEGRIASRKRGGWRIIRPANNGWGYLKVGLRVGGVDRYRKVHHLVAEAFLGPRPTPAHVTNHKSGIRDDNRVENLEWVTRSENAHHRYDVLNHLGPRGEAHHNTNLTETDVRKIRERRAKGEKLTTIAADYGICFSSVSLIAKGKNWGWLA